MTDPLEPLTTDPNDLIFTLTAKTSCVLLTLTVS